jgi:hypothetical protein
MVDSPKDETMDGASNLPERQQIMEQKLDALAVSVDTRFEQVDARFAHVDRRFDEVGAAIAEQRAYTEYVYEKLNQKMDAGFAKVDAGFGKVDARFARLERKIDQIIDLHAPRTSPNESDAE